MTVIEACFCEDYSALGQVIGHKPGTGGCKKSPIPEATLADDPERLVNEGDEDPFGGEISDEPCGARTQVGPNSWNQVTCDREPHPKAWVHIAVVDDLVEHVWRDPLPEELPLLKVTSEGVQYSCCGWLVSADGTHASTCKVGAPMEVVLGDVKQATREDREPEEPQQP